MTTFNINGESVNRKTFIGGSIALLYSIVTGQYSFAQDSSSVENLIESVESRYNNIYIYKRGPLVSMTFGHNRRLYTESVMDVRDRRLLPVEYTRYMTASLVYVENHDRILQIGLGGGRTAWYVHEYLPNTKIDVAEIDPSVIQLAIKYFGVVQKPNFNMTAADGRLFLMKNSDIMYDAIFVDAYRGPFVPFHLLTREFYELARSRLRPGGVVSQNVEPSTMIFDAAVATMRSVFKQIDFFPAGGNVVIVGYDNDRRYTQSELAAKASKIQMKYGFKHSLSDLIAARRELADQIGTRILTDDFAPVESLRSIEQNNRKWN